MSTQDHRIQTSLKPPACRDASSSPRPPRRRGVHDRAAARARPRLQAPSDLVNIAVVGISGMGARNTRAVMSQNIVAICDVDTALLDARLARWSAGRRSGPAQPRPRRRQATPAWPRGRTWAHRRRSSRPTRSARPTTRREPAAVRRRRSRASRSTATTARCSRSRKTSTPSSSRRPITCTPSIASAAMDLGKHVYVQKPMCWSVHEARHLAKKARTIRSSSRRWATRATRRTTRGAGRNTCTAGAIGDISEVHVWTNRPLGFWPQGIPRPARLDDRSGARCAGTTAASCSASARRRLSQRRLPGARQARRGICSSASRRTSSTTRSITRSTGAAGWTGARARSATWARTSSIIRCGR